MHIHIYTDGACKGNPGRGGWGVVIQAESKTWEYFGGHPHTTNNQMELTAAIQSLQSLSALLDTAEIDNDNPSIILFTDSQYVIKGITQWIEGWISKGWKTGQNKEVANKLLWQTLWAEAKNWDISWEWVKGHATNPGNIRADLLANEGVDSLCK